PTDNRCPTAPGRELDGAGALGWAEASSGQGNGSPNRRYRRGNSAYSGRPLHRKLHAVAGGVKFRHRDRARAPLGRRNRRNAGITPGNNGRPCAIEIDVITLASSCAEP